MFRYGQWSSSDKFIWRIITITLSSAVLWTALTSIAEGQFSINGIIAGIVVVVFLSAMVASINSHKTKEWLEIEEAKICPEGSIHGYGGFLEAGIAKVEYFPKDETATHYDITFTCWKCSIETTIRIPLDEVIPQELRREY